jgi:hypothetical protein
VVKLSVSVNSLSFDRCGGFLLAEAVMSNHAAKKWDEAPLYVNENTFIRNIKYA